MNNPQELVRNGIEKGWITVRQPLLKRSVLIHGADPIEQNKVLIKKRRNINKSRGLTVNGKSRIKQSHPELKGLKNKRLYQRYWARKHRNQAEMIPTDYEI